MSLQAFELLPFELLNVSSLDSGVLLICDHASSELPSDVSVSGFVSEEGALLRHIGVDIGASAVTCHLAELLGSPAVLACYSRLYIDLNRPLGDFTSMRAISDGTVIEGNCDLTQAEKQRRIDSIFHPYHEAISSLRSSMARRGDLRIIFVHSFTPCYRGFVRPWHLGILSGKRHKDFARAFLASWEGLYDFPIGDNEPYSGEDNYSYSIHEHAEKHGHLHFGLEVRQDLIDTDQKAHDMAKRIALCIEKSL